MTQELTPKAVSIMGLLRDADKWIDRNQLADMMGKNRLNPHEISMLDGLVDSGQVKRDTAEAGISEKYIYRINN